jgi:phosphoribosylglycinamide formyltransferase
VLESNPDVIVLAGWTHILGCGFLDAVESHSYSGNENRRLRGSISVINLHPALPGAFDGVTDAIRRAYDAFQRGEITKAGVMIHHVVKEVDQGEPVIVREVELINGESFESFEERMHKTEWEIIVLATAQVLKEVSH